MRIRLPAFAVAVLLPALSQEAAAQDAVSLFTQGRALVEAGNYAAACPLFAAAHRLQREAIGITINLAECYEHVSKSASAWSAYREAEFLAKRAGDGDRAQLAGDRASALQPRLAKLTVTAAVLTPGLQVRREDAEVSKDIFGTSFPVDAGTHRIEATAPGYKPWSTVVTIAKDGASLSVRVPALVPDGASGTRPFQWTPQRMAGAGVGTVGLVAAGIGGALGGVAISKYNGTKTACSPTQPNVCTSAGLSQRATAGKLADASTGMLVAGGVAAAAGVVVLVTAQPEAGARTSAVRKIEASPAVGPGTAGLTLRGEW